MNNIMRIKRGSTTSWSLGPEMVQWENLDVWGKDSLIHCEGTDLEMNVYTASANYFYDENGQLENVKRPGLWLIQPGEINWDASAQAEFKCWTSGPSDCWLEVAAPSTPSVHGQQLPLGQQVQMTMPYLGEWGLYIRWPEQRENVGVANIKLSIREVDAYEELAPGQLGVEYTEDGKTKLKAGMPNVSKWNELPYIGNEQAIDWDIAEESSPAAIKNKPFGMVEQIVDIVPEAEYSFHRPNETTTEVICLNTFSYNYDLFHDVWFNDIYLGTAKPGERIEIPNGHFYFETTVMVICSGSYPEGNYKVRVAERQIVAKRLDSQWLNTQNNIYAAGVEYEPASCSGVITAIGTFGNAVSNVRNRLDHVVIPAIGPVPTDADNGKLLQVVGGKPAWVEANIGPINEALDAIIAIQKELIGLITFTIDGTEYQAEDGMTWREWCESEYCNGAFTVGAYPDGDYVFSQLSGSAGFGVASGGSGLPVFGLADQKIIDDSTWILVE